MRKYDLLSISLLMFSVILVTAMAVGPTGLSLTALQAWQPLMAAIIALGAGTLAFRGAMAKVEFDRTVHSAQQRQRLKNLHTKLLYSAYIFLSETGKAAGRFGGFQRSQRTVKDFAVGWQPEFDEAWTSIDLLSEDSAHILANIKYNFDLFKSAVNNLDQNATWEFSYVVPTELEGAVKSLKELEIYAQDFVRSLESSRPS